MLYIIISCWLLYLMLGAAWIMIYPYLMGERLDDDGGGAFILLIFWPLHLFLLIIALVLSGKRKAWET